MARSRRGNQRQRAARPESARELLLPLEADYGLQPVKLPYAWIFNTTSLYAEPAVAK